MSQKESEIENEIKHIIESNALSHGRDITADDDVVVRIASFVERREKMAVSNREKEIAEEVEGSVYAAFFSEAGEDDFEEYNNWRKNVLPGIILKHQ